jgi:hypothetical protein
VSLRAGLEDVDSNFYHLVVKPVETKPEKRKRQDNGAFYVVSIA